MMTSGMNVILSSKTPVLKTVPSGSTNRSVKPSVLFETGAVVDLPPLDGVEWMSVACIMHKAVFKLGVIQNLLPQPYSLCPETYKPLYQRMTRLHRLVPPEDQETEDSQLLTKVQKCRCFVQDIFEKTIKELRDQGTWHYLLYSLCCDDLKKFDDICLKNDYINISQTVLQLEKKLSDLKVNSIEVLLYLSKMTGPCLEHAISKAWVQTETLKIKTEFSERARLAQSVLRIREKEDLVSNTVDKCNLEMQDEQKIGLAVQDHLYLVTNQLQEDLHKWTVKYNNEVELLDVELLQVNSDFNELKEKHEKLQKSFLARREWVSIMQEESNERDRVMAENLKRTKAAKKIQLWWRAYLLRKFIQKKIFKKKLGRNKVSGGSIKKQKNKTKKKIK